MEKIRSTVAALTLVSMSVLAQVPINAAQLTNKLDEYRETCAAMASKLSSDESTARLKERLESDLERQQIKMDVEIYAVGHGRNKTTEYYLDRLQKKAEKDKERSSQLAEQGKRNSDTVSACVAQALDQGKTLYATFKGSKRRNKDIDEASAVMTAWVVNTQTISIGAPQGTNESKNEWQKAKARAELEAL